MKSFLRKFLLTAAVVSSVGAYAQRVKVSAALGGSAYYGDLVQGAPLIKQISAAFTFGGSYDFTEQLRARFNVSTLGIKGDDKDNAREDYKARNLNFKSFVWELSAAAEYDFLNNTSEYGWTPYVFAGPGLFHFNPTTIDKFGEKVNLRDFGTDGQGLSAFPDRKPYSLTQFNIGFGGGVRFDLTEDLSLGGEIFIRKTFSDYLDDVSQNSYVDPSQFTNPYSALLAFRGDEVGKPFPGVTLPRGNPSSKDLFYTFQLKLTYRLANISWGGGLGFYGGSGRQRGSMRNPGRVL